MASYDFDVLWEVQTAMYFHERHFASEPFEVQVVARAEDLRDLFQNSPATIQAHDVDRVAPWHVAPWRVEPPRAYLFETPVQAVNEFFDAVGEASGDARAVFWDEARVPTFGSPPEKWERLSEVVQKGVPGAAYGTIIVGLHDEPATLLLALAGLTVIVRIVDPVAGAVGMGLVGKIQRAFDTPTSQRTRQRKRKARGRREARPAADGAADGVADG